MVALGGAGQFDCNERVAQHGAQCLEAVPHQRVSGVAQAQDLAAFGSAAGNGERIVWREVEVGGARSLLLTDPEDERHRRLAQHWSDHDVVDHHPQRKTAAEAHSQSAHARPTHIGVQVAGECAQEGDDR